MYGAIFLALIGPASIILPLGPIKDLRFLSPVLAAPFIFVAYKSYKSEANIYFKQLFNLFLIVAVYTVIISIAVHDLGFTYRNIVNLILLFTPLVFSWGIINYSSPKQIDRIIKFLFYVFTLFYIAELFKGGISVGAFLQVFRSNIVTESYYDTESGISLIMGFYYLYFLHNKKYRYAAFAALITILGAKRIAIFGIFVCTMFYLFFPLHRLTKSKRFYGVLFLTIGSLIAITWDGIITGSFNQIIQDLTGVNANRFFMGRLNRFQLVFSHFTEMPIWGVGLGLGYLENILYYEVQWATAFHGDFYRIFLEFGPILFGVWLFITGKFASVNKLALTVTLLVIILLQTDNAFIYNRIMFSYYLMMGYALIQNKLNG
jgi:hypothetical protein